MPLISGSIYHGEREEDVVPIEGDVQGKARRHLTSGFRGRKEDYFKFRCVRVPSRALGISILDRTGISIPDVKNGEEERLLPYPVLSIEADIKCLVYFSFQHRSFHRIRP